MESAVLVLNACHTGIQQSQVDIEYLPEGTRSGLDLKTNHHGVDVRGQLCWLKDKSFVVPFPLAFATVETYHYSSVPVNPSCAPLFVQLALALGREKLDYLTVFVAHVKNQIDVHVMRQAQHLRCLVRGLAPSYAKDNFPFTHLHQPSKRNSRFRLQLYRTDGIEFRFLEISSNFFAHPFRDAMCEILFLRLEQGTIARNELGGHVVRAEWLEAAFLHSLEETRYDDVPMVEGRDLGLKAPVSFLHSKHRYHRS
mmetsp:Transcript_35459/g.56976  ORF Transcript_35459/g.56976 Transcript_35459/m.56976 type:complete len:254 (-) Transcript_35459:202-963(-)